MHFKRHLTIERGLKSIYAAPLVNIALLLFMFFIITSGLVSHPGMKINLPKVLESGLLSSQRVEFRVSADNKVYFNGGEISGSGLREALKQLAPRRVSVVILSDKSASFEAITNLWGACRDFGITQVSLAAER